MGVCLARELQTQVVIIIIIVTNIIIIIIIIPGSVWPPYPGAGQGYWAARAGFYKTRPANRELFRSAQSDTETVEPSKSFVYNGNTRYIP